MTDESLLLNPDNEGKVGIGTNSPREKLEVKGSIRISLNSIHNRVGMTENVVNVLDFGACGDGVTDNTDAFQEALDFASSTDDRKSSIGGIVFAPAGVYRFTGNISVPAGVTLKGVFHAPHDWNESVKAGTVFEPMGTSGEQFIALNGEDAALAGVTIFYPQQKIENGEPVDYPWTIRCYPSDGSGAASGGTNSVINVTLVNPTRGIYVGKSAYNGVNNRVHLCGVYSGALLVGIEIDNNVDGGLLEDIRFWDFWSKGGERYEEQGGQWVTIPMSYQTQAIDYRFAHGKALILRKCDNLILNNFFAIGYETGILTDATPSQPPTYQSTWAQFSNIGLDTCKYGIHFNRVQPNGVVVTNLHCACPAVLRDQVAIEGAIGVGLADQEDHETLGGRVVIDSGHFWGPGYNGDGGMIRCEKEKCALVVSNCIFDRFGAGPVHAIRLLAEEGTVTVANNIILTDGTSNDNSKAIEQTYSSCSVAYNGNIVNGKANVVGVDQRWSPMNIW